MAQGLVLAQQLGKAEPGTVIVAIVVNNNNHIQKYMGCIVVLPKSWNPASLPPKRLS